MRTAILDVINQPTSKDPITSTCLRWLSKDVPLALRLLTKPRDMVLVDAAGMTTLATGERVGYRVLQTVNFPELPPIQDFDRIDGATVVSILRQQSPTTIATQALAVLDVKKAALKPLVVQSIGAALLGVVSPMTTSSRPIEIFRRLQGSSLATEHAARAASQHKPSLTQCTVCHQISRAHRMRSCELCDKPVCRSCVVKQRLPLAQMRDHTCVHVCVACVLRIETSQALRSAPPSSLSGVARTTPMRIPPPRALWSPAQALSRSLG